jgi:hypothetical protein
MAFLLFSDVLKVKNSFVGVSQPMNPEVDFVGGAGGNDYCVRKHDLC